LAATLGDGEEDPDGVATPTVGVAVGVGTGVDELGALSTVPTVGITDDVTDAAALDAVEVAPGTMADVVERMGSGVAERPVSSAIPVPTPRMTTPSSAPESTKARRTGLNVLEPPCSQPFLWFGAINRPPTNLYVDVAEAVRRT
jgi:hypothetical protein